MEPAEQRDAVRERIVQGARKHFFAHGFRGVTMDDLAGELGMSKKTLYVHFGKKTELLEAVLTDKFARVDADISAITEDEGMEFRERLHKLLANMRKHTEEVQPSFHRDVAKESPELFEKIRARRRMMIHKHFTGMIRRGKAAGMIRRDVPDKLMVEMLIATADTVANPRMLDELGLSVREAFAKIITVFLTGVMTEEGRKSL